MIPPRCQPFVVPAGVRFVSCCAGRGTVAACVLCVCVCVWVWVWVSSLCLCPCLSKLKYTSRATLQFQQHT